MADEKNQQQPQQQQNPQNQTKAAQKEEKKEIKPEDRKEVNPSRLTQDDINAYLDSEERRAQKPQEILISWQAPEFQQVQRPQQWYWLFAVVGIAMAIWAIFTANYLFALIIIILTIVLNSFFRRKPKNITIAITPEGVSIDNRFYSYTEDLKSFWILYNPPSLKALHFSHNSTLQPDIVVELENENPLKVREALLRYLPEDTEKEENNVDEMFRRWGF